MTIQFAFFDLDGTVLDSKTHKVPEFNKQVIHDLQAKGIKCYVASGRSYPLLKDMEGVLDIPWDGYICNNGSCVHDKMGTAIHTTAFSEEQVIELIQLCEQEHMTLSFHLENDEVMAPLGIDRYMIQAHTWFAEPLPETIKPYNHETVVMALVFNAMDYDFSKIESVEGLKPLPNQSTYADVVLKSVSKATGIASILKDYNASLDECIAFGDADNDIDMLRYVPLSICMGNGTPATKEVASYITDDVDKEGIRKALEHFHIL